MINRIWGFVALLSVAGVVYAQTAEQSLDVSRYKGKAPAPLYYPNILAEPEFTLAEPAAPNIMFGQFKVELGKTKLSEVVKTLGGSLQHLKDRTEFVCYSAPVDQPKARKKKKASEEETFQNVWLILGKRGQISQAMAEQISAGAKKCPPLSEENQTVSFGNVKIGQKIDSLKLPPASKKDEENNWNAWFSQTANSGITEVGVLAIRTTDKKLVDNIISLALSFKQK